MTRTDSAKLAALVALAATLLTVASFAIATGQTDIFNGLALVCVAFARALPGLVRADTGKGSRS